MEALENGGGRKVARRKLLVIEDYLHLIDNRNLPLTVSQLRQIIGMHGFKKIEAAKTVLTEMVTSMELMDLHRSTLLDGAVSGDACLTLEEVINDLKSLNWQDCHVTSILTYGAGVPAPSAGGDWSFSLKRKGSRRSGKKKRKAIKGAVDNSVISSNGPTVVTTEAC